MLCIRFISADPDPLRDTDSGSKKSWEIHIKINQNLQDFLFCLEIPFFDSKNVEIIFRSYPDPLFHETLRNYEKL